MQIQDRIEQSAKEYIDYKNVLENRLKESANKKEDFSKIIIDEENAEEVYSKYFDTFSSSEMLAIDASQAKVKLYHYISLAEDIVEIPQEIKKLVEDYSPKYMYSKDGELVDKQLYKQYKENYIRQALELDKQLNTPHK